MLILQENCGGCEHWTLLCVCIICICICIWFILQIIDLSASANNKLSKIQEHAEEYAALIMEELDPDNLGYIEVIYILYSIYTNINKTNFKLIR